MSSSPTETMQRIEVVMPQLGVSIAEGTVAGWLKEVGDAVAADEPVCEVTTDKIDIEIPSPGAGELVEILVEPGETVAVGTPLGILSGPADDAVAEDVEPSVAGGAEPDAELDRSSFLSPVVRRMLDEHGLDPSTVDGTGVGGRIRREDVERMLADAAGDGQPTPSLRSERPLHSESPYRPEPEPESKAVPTGNAEPAAPAGSSQREPLSPMRRAIAEHMVASLRTSAHCTTVIEADFSGVEAERAAIAERTAPSEVRPTPLAFVAAATVAALRRFPQLNASIEDDELVRHDAVHLGIAVDIGEGLIVPVVRHAERLSVEGLAVAIADLAERARSGRLAPEETRGGTFTITNPGRHGALMATPIINQPQVGILDLEAIVRRPVVVGEQGGEAIAIRPIGCLCMSWDHRALDGVLAARFLAAIRDGIEAGGPR